MYTLVQHYSAVTQGSANRIQRETAKERAHRGLQAYYEIRNGDRLTTVSVRNDLAGMGHTVLQMARLKKKSARPQRAPQRNGDGYVFLEFGKR